MDIISLCKMLGNLTGYKIYPINFPTGLKNSTVAKLEIITGMVETGGVYDFNIEISVKADHPSKCEKMCLDLINKLHRQTDVEHGSYQMILCQAEKPYPSYIGELETGEYLFTSNFRLLTCIM